MQERILSIPSQTDIEPTKRSFTRIGTWEIDTLNVEKTLPKDIEMQAIKIDLGKTCANYQALDIKQVIGLLKKEGFI